MIIKEGICRANNKDQCVTKSVTLKINWSVVCKNKRPKDSALWLGRSFVPEPTRIFMREHDPLGWDF